MSDPCVAEPQDKDWFRKADWLARHELLLKARDAARDAQIVFLGDSITEGWAGDGKAAWTSYFAPLKPLNLGIGGDETSHILWRMENGELDGLNPKVLVLLIGTNNIGNVGHTGKATAEGMRRIVSTLRQKLPATKILLLAVFPRDEQPGTPFRKEIAELNAIIGRLHDGQMVHFVDYSQLFLQCDRVLPRELFPDSLHLSAKAYEIWAKAMIGTIEGLMK